ncbi:hypothetical protein QWY77_09370 [Thalassotalea ponticola]|nr:hypothetical protein [Thalassotalea ponticola]MDN3652966.1 hypothetical protein [Thalassotalea ponticola]
MKLRVYVFRAPIRVLRIKRKRGIYQVRRQMLTLKMALAQEKQETREMLTVYLKYTRKQATKDEMKIANKQFFDLLKGLGIGVVAILPFAPITIPIMIKLGDWVGVDILPSSFSDKNRQNREIR